MSNFSFSRSVFKKLVSQRFQKVSLCGNGLKTLRKNLFENLVGKRENDGYQHFLLFSQCFRPYQRQKKKNIYILAIFILTSANAFSLDRIKILLFGEELKKHVIAYTAMHTPPVQPLPCTGSQVYHCKDLASVVKRIDT